MSIADNAAPEPANVNPQSMIIAVLTAFGEAISDPKQADTALKFAHEFLKQSSKNTDQSTKDAFIRLGVIFREATKSGYPKPLPQKPVTYRDYTIHSLPAEYKPLLAGSESEYVFARDGFRAYREQAVAYAEALRAAGGQPAPAAAATTAPAPTATAEPPKEKKRALKKGKKSQIVEDLPDEAPATQQAAPAPAPEIPGVAHNQIPLPLPVMAPPAPVVPPVVQDASIPLPTPGMPKMQGFKPNAPVATEAATPPEATAGGDILERLERIEATMLKLDGNMKKVAAAFNALLKKLG